jgi:hypothetical protein
MKKIISTLSLFLLIFATSFANSSKLENYGYYGKGKSFNFIEENVHFMVYQNGEFDFFIEQPDFSVGVNLGNVNITFNSGYNYDAYVLYDDFGAVIQIENIPIYYDYYGRISRIGNTYIRYHNRKIIQFGTMYVHYNHYGYFDHCSGYINVYNRHYNYRPYVSYFTRPVFNHCIVSYQPYRRHYRPVRYRYNSDEFRRRARNNSYYRTNTTVVRKKSVPKRVAPTTRTNSRRSSSPVRDNVRRSANNHRTSVRNSSVRRNNNGHSNPRVIRNVSQTRRVDYKHKKRKRNLSLEKKSTNRSLHSSARNNNTTKKRRVGKSVNLRRHRL